MPHQLVQILNNNTNFKMWVNTANQALINIIFSIYTNKISKLKPNSYQLEMPSDLGKKNTGADSVMWQNPVFFLRWCPKKKKKKQWDVIRQRRFQRTAPIGFGFEVLDGGLDKFDSGPKGKRWRRIPRMGDERRVWMSLGFWFIYESPCQVFDVVQIWYQRSQSML